MPDNSIRASVDAYVDEARPASNFGSSANIFLNGLSGSTHQGFIYFAPPFKPGDTVFTATLRLYLAGAPAWSGSNTITVERITEKWGENSIRWSNRPAVDALHLAQQTVVGGVAGQEVDFDITSMLQDVAAGSPFFGVRVRVSTTSNRAIHGAEYPDATMRAQLEINWSRIPFEADNLNPSGGLAVSLAKPTLAWQFDSEDPDAERTQAYSQVQISTSTDFSSPEYDSGKVANTDASWDLSATAYGGVAADASRYWRVRVWDDLNQVSEWSGITNFVRRTQGTLAISNPPAPASNVVNETTPPITFSLTGRTQQAVKIILYQLDGTRQIEKWTYPKTVTTDTSIEVPKGIIKSTEQYRVAVQVWDTLDRATTQGDPAYVRLTRDFTYVRNGAVSPVTNLTAVQVGPGVVLTWHRSSAPLLFCLRVNGIEVRDDILPDDVFVSGDTYRMSYSRGVSGTTNTYEVEAIDVSAGQLKHSQANDEDTLTLNITAKWLVDDWDDSGSIAVEFMERQQTDLKLGKSGTIYNTVAGQRPIEIIDAIRGYEGTVSGLLSDTDAKETLEQMVARARPIRFIQSTMNIPVEIQGEPNIAPASEHLGPYYSASVPISQVGEFLDVPAT